MTAAPVETAAKGRRKRRGREPLPPFPHEVPLPDTFGAWYDLAAANLAIAVRRDSSGRRMIAGLVMMLGTTLGFALASEQVLVLLGHGYDGQRADIASIVLGGLFLVGTQVWWWWYRRDWGRARRLRRAWSAALRSPEVLALPVRGDQNVDDEGPESRHAFRARRYGKLPVAMGVDPEVRVGGTLDVLRMLLYPLVFGFGLVIVAASLDVDATTLGQAVGSILMGLLVVCVGFFASVRAWRRYGDGAALSGLEANDHARWTGWRVLHGLEKPAEEQRPWWRRLNLAMLPVAGGGLVVLLARAASGGVRVDGVVIGVGIVVVPILVVYGSFVVRVLVGRVRARGREVAVRVLVDDVPAQGPVTVAPGRAVLDLGERPVLRPVSGASVGLDGAALISGQPRMFAARRHWVVLVDGSQVPVACADVRRLRGLAESAGWRVL